MSEHAMGPSPSGLRGPLAIGLAVVLAACVGTASSPGSSAYPSSAPASPLSIPSTGPTSAVPSAPPSAPPTVAPSVAPSPFPEDSTGPTVAPGPYQLGDTDPATGLKLTFVDEGSWTDTTAPSRKFSLTWRTPDSTGTEVRVEGITACPAPENSTGIPCVTATTKLPASIVHLVTSVPAASRSAGWTWPAWEEIGEPIASDGSNSFYAIVVTFTTGTTSKVVVVVTSETCSGCAY